MAIIRAFTIQGLAGRSEPTHATLDRRVNVFWGLNGTGKTTLLRVLDCAMRNSTNGLEALPFDSAEVMLYDEESDSDFTRTLEKERTLASMSEDPFADVFTLDDLEVDSFDRRRMIYRTFGKELTWET